MPSAVLLKGSVTGRHFVFQEIGFSRRGAKRIIPDTLLPTQVMSKLYCRILQDGKRPVAKVSQARVPYFTIYVFKLVEKRRGKQGSKSFKR